MNTTPGCDPLTLLKPDQVATILGVRPATLAIWRSTGRQNLQYIKVGKFVMYRRSAVEEFIRSRERS